VRGRLELDTGHHQRLRLQIHSDSELVLDDRTASRFATFFAAVDVAPNARLRLLRIQNAGASAHRLTRLKIALGRDSRLDAVTVDLGGAFIRHDLDITFRAPGAEAQLHGLYVAHGSAHVDNHTCVDHRAGHCTSRESFRGIALDKGRAVFNGKIVVHPGAQKTDSEQRVANLILSKGAEIDAKPELEIYADDVKCAHGATFGQLDEDAIFYLRSRGIGEAAARRLLISAFAHEILDRIGDEALRERVAREFEARLK
jgi:Fe-S cluster assembly protein SufD